MKHIVELIEALENRSLSRRQMIQACSLTAAAAVVPSFAVDGAIKATWCNHYTYVAPDLKKTRDWYHEVYGMQIGHDTYRAALIERENFRAMHDALAQRADGFITLSSPGPGPIGMDQGSAIFNEASSILGAPALNLPLLAVDQAPLGVQLLGRWHADESLTAIGRWLAEVHCGRPA